MDKIKAISAREILDSRGNPTVEANARIKSRRGRRALFIGAFLLISLVISRPVLAEEPLDPGSGTNPGSGDTSLDQPANGAETDPGADPTTDPGTDPTTPPADQVLSDDQIADLAALDQMLANGEIDQEEYDARKDAILGTVANQSSNAPFNVTGANPKSQTLGKYLSPDVSVVDGSLSYAYPIVVPPGRAGLNPDLKLIYDSNNTDQNSIIGTGWAFNIPYIQRMKKKVATRDEIYNFNNFTSSLDGELVDQGSGVFKPRVETGSFLKYRYSESNKTWTVTDKKGTQYKFGVTAGARQDNPDNSAQVFTWMLEQVVDTNGNTIAYTYYKDQGQIYPNAISYNQTGTFTIEFSRVARLYPSTSYGTLFKVATVYRISGLNVKIDGVLTNKYTIAADNSNLVGSILVEGYQGTQVFSLPSTQFKNFTDEGLKKWGYNPNYSLPIDPVTNKVLALDYKNSVYYGNSFIDINGDGLPDIVRWAVNKPNGYSSSVSGNEIFLNTGTGFVLAPNFLLPADTNGKVYALDFNCPNTTSDPNCTNPYYGNSFIDINGDGLPDIVRWWAGHLNGETSSDLRSGNQVFINTGSSFVLDPNYLLPTDATGKVLVLDYNNVDYYGNSFKDVNGDGRPDVVRWDASQPNGYSSVLRGNQIFLNTGTGFVAAPNFLLPTSPTNGKVLTLDYKYSNNTTNFFGNSFMDINGDGLIDIVRWTGGQPNGYYSSSSNKNGNQVFINTGSGFVLDPNYLLPTALNGKVLALDYKYGAVNTFYGNSFLDVNGDGLPDVVRWTANQANGYANSNYTSGNQVFLNTGTGFVLDPNYLLPTDANGKVLALDYNYSSTYGNSFKDINGDDLPDVVRWDTRYANGYASSVSGNQIFVNTGSKFILDSGFTVPLATNGKALTIDYTVCKAPQVCSGVPSNLNGSSLLDINGDGILDVLRWDNSQLNAPPSNPTRGNQVLLGAVGRKAVKRIIGGSGGEDVFAFKAARQFTDPQSVGLNHNFPSWYKPFVVASRAADDKNGHVGITTYEYRGASYFNPYDSPFNKKIAGFGEVTETTPSGAVLTTKYHQGNGQTPNDSYARIGKAYEETVKDASGNLYSRVHTNYTENNIGGLANSLLVSDQLTQTFDGNSSHKDTEEAYAYDQYGNLTQKVSLGEVVGSPDGSATDIGNDLFTENIAYVADNGDYVVGLPYSDTVLDQAGNKVREAEMYYDNLALGSVGAGNRTKTGNWKTGTTYTNTQIAYNSYGLPTSSTDARGKTTSYTYDANNLYPATITDPLTHTTQFSYDYSTGQVKQATDPNGFRYQTVFDTFGRVLEERVPDLTAPYTPVLKTKYVYTDTPLRVSVKKMDYVDDANLIDAYQYFDGFGRLVQERQEAEGVWKFNVRDLVYNNEGNLLKESLKYVSDGATSTSPTTTAALYTSYNYDLLNRVTGTSNSLGATRIVYDDWKTLVADANGHIKSYYQDAYGNLVKVKEEQDNSSPFVTSYEWNGNKNLTKITDALDNVRNFTYDGLGRRLTAEDLHAPLDTTFGVWHYHYDDAGNLTETESPAGKTIDYTYDDLNRVLTEDQAGTNNTGIAYAYDCVNQIGKLCVAAMVSGADTVYTYNSNGALAEESQTIDGAMYTTAYTYDRLGNILTITYPDNSQVRYSYNNAGLLEKIERKESGGSFTDVVSNFNYSPLGQVTTQVNANGTTATNTYEATKLYRLTRQLTQNTAAVKLQDLNYDYDPVGNLTSIRDASDPNMARTTTYSYDELNRLISASQPDPASGQPYNQIFSYDALGNILSGGAGDYSYSGAGYTNPQAVTNIIGPSGNYTFDFAYDQDGNLTSKTATALSAVLTASVNPNGLNAHAKFTGTGLNDSLQDLGSGSSPVSLTSHTLVFAPNSSYTYQVEGYNESTPSVDGGSLDGSNTISLATASGPDPLIISATISHITTDSATISGQINPNGRATDAWYETNAPGYGGQQQLKHISDCHTPESLSALYLSGLDDSATYQFRIVAQNDQGTTATSWTSFTTLYKYVPPPPPAIPNPPLPYHPPYLVSLNLTPNISALPQFDNVAYTWNYKNQLTEVANSTSHSAYSYDYAGNRVKATVTETKINNTRTTYYPNKLYEKTVGPSETTRTRYIYAGNTLVATVKKVGSANPTVSYIHPDHLGSTNVVSDSSGNMAQAIDYYPYGAERVCGGPGGSSCDAEKKYIGQYFDTDTSLNYLNARYYDSNIGRFASQDPVFLATGNEQQIKNITGQKFANVLMDPQSLNSYSYAGNNPITFSDPQGKWFKELITGQQSWSDFVVEVGDAANYLYDNNGTWRVAMDHPVATGAVVGVGGGTAAYAGAAGLTYLSINYLGGVGTACLFGCSSVVQKAPEYAQQGYRTFQAFKNAVGSADPTGQNLRQWHHIVEQTDTNIENFGQEALQNGQNIVNVPTALHQQISSYYSSIQSFTNGQTVRTWLSSQSFTQQANFGRQILEKAISNTSK